MVTTLSLKETLPDNSATTTTTTTATAAAAISTTTSHDGQGESTQAVYFTVSFTFVGIVVVAVCSAIFIWSRRRKGRTVIKDFSCYKDKNTMDNRDTYRIENIQASVEMFPCSTLDRRCIVGNSDDQYIREDLLRKEITTDYGYSTIYSLAEPLSSVHSYSSINQPEEVLRVNLYDTLQTNANKRKAKAVANARKTKINAYDHVITENQQEGEFASPTTSTLENSSLRLKRGRRSNRKDTCRKDASELYNCTADSCFSKRYVVLESDGFYFANEETEA